MTDDDGRHRCRDCRRVWTTDDDGRLTWDPKPESEPSGKYAHRGVSTVNTWDPVDGEAVDVPGHPMDRVPDMDEDEARRLALRGEFDDLDDDQRLPVLSSSMSADPCEGVQGSWSAVSRIEDISVDGDTCPACGKGYAVQYMASTLGGVGGAYCLTCDEELVAP